MFLAALAVGWTAGVRHAGDAAKLESAKQLFVADNYAACHDNAAKLAGLQYWAKVLTGTD